MDFLDEFLHLKIQLEEIKSATDNFGANNIIGKGGFGNVYKGEISRRSSKGRIMVAFKRLDRRFGQGDPEFWKEIMMLSRHSHENLVSLLGYCDEGGEKILVYELASRGSLDRYLSDVTLSWRQRLKICLAAARGLNHLHDPKGTKQRVIHRDIKSSNILLDGNWNPKLSDMGLSKLAPANQQHTAVLTNVVGTPGYCDPLYIDTYVLTKESDVYSFGVVLVEVMCGKLCYEHVRLISISTQFEPLVPMWRKSYELKKLDEILFRDLKPQMDPTSLEKFSNIAYQCLQIPHEKRPSMASVVKEVELALEYQDIAEGRKPSVELKTKIMPLSKGVHINGGFNERTTSNYSKDTGETEFSMEILINEIDLKMEYSLEKLLNLEILLLNLETLLMDLESWETDFEAVAAGDVSVEFVEKSMTIDLLCSFMDSEVKELECSMESMEVELVDAHKRLSLCKHLGELFSVLEGKLHDCEESLKISQEQVLEMKMKLANLQMTSLLFSHYDEYCFPEDEVSNIKVKPRTHTMDNAHILRMLEKSLSSEIELEKKLMESKQAEEDLKVKLRLTEEAAEVVWGRFLEAEHAAVVLTGVSRDLVAQHQLDLDGFNRREDVLRSKLDNCIKLLNAKDSSIEKLNIRIAQLVADNLEVSTLREKVKFLEEKVKEFESNFEKADVLNESIRERAS